LIIEFKKIIPIDELIANWGGIFGKVVYNIGIAMTPPPTPKKDEIRPTMRPVRRSKTKVIIKLL